MADENDDTTSDDAVEAEAPATEDATAKADPEADQAGTTGGEATEDKAAKAERKAKADKVVAERTVTRRTVTSRRVTPKAGSGSAAATSTTTGSKARDAKKTETASSRSATPPVQQQVYAKGPSPWWVPAIMFGLLIIGALVIMSNYMVGDSASNTRLVIGLGFILGGIVTATQYR